MPRPKTTKSNAKRNVKEIYPDLFKTLHSFIILAAGQSEKIKSGNKSLLKLFNNETVIDRQIRIIKERFTNPNIVVVTGFDANTVMDKMPLGITCVENEGYALDGITRSIGIGLRAVTTDKVFVIYGDLVFNDKLFSHHVEHSYVVTDKGGLMGSSRIGSTSDEGKLELLMFELSHKWAQIAYFQGEELRKLKALAYDKSKSKLFGYELINMIIHRGGQFSTLANSNVKIFDVDQLKDLEKFHRL